MRIYRVSQKKRTNKTNKNGQTWQACQHSKVVQRGPKGFKMINLDVFDNLGPFWAHLDTFGPNCDQTILKCKMLLSSCCQAASSAVTSYCQCFPQYHFQHQEQCPKLFRGHLHHKSTKQQSVSEFLTRPGNDRTRV